MKLLAISEHYYPRVGGTVNYVHETLCALADRGVTAELWVPGPEPEAWRPEGMEKPPYAIRWLDAGYPFKGDPTREQRYDFCSQVNRLAADRVVSSDCPDVLHVLFGLFIMEVLDTDALRRNGVPSVATVHNVPPMECRQITHDAALPSRMKEALRLKAVTLKNATRLRRHVYDLYVVPSEQVKGLLQPIVRRDVATIGHGFTSDLQQLMTPPATRVPQDQLRLLTAGGYVPHKRQHLIPAIAASLRMEGLDFRWDVVGPPGRVHGYFNGIQRDISERGLGDMIRLHKAVPFADLAGLYDQAHLYVQPSIEEGFCLTALDAVAAGLPVIGSKAGALPEIIEVSGGCLVESAPEPLARKIADFYRNVAWPDAGQTAFEARTRFSWARAAEALLSQYTRQVGQVSD